MVEIQKHQDKEKFLETSLKQKERKWERASRSLKEQKDWHNYLRLFREAMDLDQLEMGAMLGDLLEGGHPTDKSRQIVRWESYKDFTPPSEAICNRYTELVKAWEEVRQQQYEEEGRVDEYEPRITDKIIEDFLYLTEKARKNHPSGKSQSEITDEQPSTDVTEASKRGTGRKTKFSLSVKDALNTRQEQRDIARELKNIRSTMGETQTRMANLLNNRLNQEKKIHSSLIGVWEYPERKGYSPKHASKHYLPNQEIFDACIAVAREWDEECSKENKNHTPQFTKEWEEKLRASYSKVVQEVTNVARSYNR